MSSTRKVLIITMTALIAVVIVIAVVTPGAQRDRLQIRPPPHVFILCVRSRPEVVRFAESVKRTGYLPVIVIDTPEGSPPPSSIRHVHVPPDTLKKEGYTQLNESALGLHTCAWCAAIWLARNVNTHCWFLEEDVFMCNPKSLQQIDASHKSTDLLCAKHSPAESDWSHLGEWKEHRPFPKAYTSMMCACRMSPRLLRETRKFAHRSGRLYFLEYFFNSLCVQKGLSVATPPELQTVVYRAEYDRDDVRANPSFLYHPIKDLALHESLRVDACA